MPMYTYRCEKCGEQVDLIQPHDQQAPPTTDDAPTPCEAGRNEGAAHTWTKVIHAPNVARGAGWGGGKGNW
jgi:putative FmdB family regulatory protein